MFSSILLRMNMPSTRQLTPVIFAFVLTCPPTTPLNGPQALSVRTVRQIDRLFDSGHAYESARFFTQFWRIAGGPGFDSCLNYIERNLDALGFQRTRSTPGRSAQVGRYQILEDPPERKVWIPEDALLSLQSPEIRVLHSFSSTPLILATNSFSNDVTAPLTYVSGGNKESDYDQLDVEGRVVLCDAHPAQAYRLALKRGAVGLISAYVPPHNHPEKHPDIIADNGLPYDDQLRPFAINISPRTAAELKQMLGNQQVVIRVQMKTSFAENPIKTLVAEIPGSTRPEQQIVLVAHLDHYKPGANDNASGAATLLEIVRSVAAGIREGRLPVPARTLTFLWVDEYRGTHLWMKHQGENMSHVLSAFVLDMVGGDPEKTGGMFRVERMPDPGVVWFRPPEQHSGWGVGRWDKHKLFGSYLNDFYLSLVKGWAAEKGWKTTQNVWEGGSDHDPFLRRGIPAILS
ncbi:MAG: M28 family peptidase [Ignavibacteria bacterium]|nr:M28 family peptidase [Ignavibacteria bacterium]